MPYCFLSICNQCANSVKKSKNSLFGSLDFIKFLPFTDNYKMINFLVYGIMTIVICLIISTLPDALVMVMMKLGDVKRWTKHLLKLLGLNLL